MLLRKKLQSGFALLMSLVVVSVVIAVLVSLMDLTIKQLRLATISKDSESAFYAASGGVDCILYHRHAFRGDYETGGSVPVSCFTSPAVPGTVDIIQNALPSVYHYNYTLNWPSAFGQPARCSIVDMLTINSEPGDIVSNFNNIQNYIPSSPENSIACPSGGRCTVISVRGYNAHCNDIGRIGIVERDILLQL